MTVIGLSMSKTARASRYRRVLEKIGVTPLALRPGSSASIEEILDRIDGLLLTGGEDIDPSYYSELPEDATPDKERDAFELPLVYAAIDRDMPILGVCRGMQAINVAMGGKLIQHVKGHRSPGKKASVFHDIYIAPGSRLGAILGGGPIIRVNSRHRQGFTQALKAPGLMASAYVLKGDLIEGVEAPYYSWIVGVQWHPERETENHPKNINLFHSLMEAANRVEARR